MQHFKLFKIKHLVLWACLGLFAPSWAVSQTIVFEETFEGITSPNSESALVTEREAGTFQANAVTPGWTQTGATGQFIKFNGDSGNTAFLLNEAGTDRNAISREISGLTAGAQYRISFEYWGDNYGTYGYSFEWGIAGEVMSVEEEPFELNSGNFNTVSHQFTAIGPSTNLGFTETSFVAASPVLDNIVIEQLTFPEVTDLEPLAYYPLDGSGDEATGNNINLSPFGEPNYGPAASPGLGQTLVVDGVDDALVGSGYIPSSTGQLTLSAWVLAESRTTWASIFKNWNGQFHLGIDNGLAGSGSNGKLSNYINLDGVGGQPYVVAPDLFPLSVWTHTAVVIDSTKQTQKLFIDGIHVATGVFTSSLRSIPCSGLGIAVKPTCDGIGPVTSADGGFWHGQLDEVVAWDLALSDAQIADIYDRLASGIPLIVFNQPPVANPGLSIETAVGETIQISGLGSTDDATAPTDLAYAWTLTSQPSGSASVLYGANNYVASLRPDMPGSYMVELVVTDEEGAVSEPAEMQVGADLDPSFVFEKIFDGYSTYYRDASRYESAYQISYPRDAGEGRAILLRTQGASSFDYSTRTSSGFRNQNLDLFNGNGFETRISATYPVSTTPYRHFYDARFTDGDQFRFLASYRESASTGYRTTLLETTPEGAEAILFPSRIDGYQLYVDTYLSTDERGWLRGYRNDCIQERSYVYPDGGTYTYCVARTQAIFELGPDGPLRVLDNSTVLPPGGGVFYYFSRVARTQEGGVLFSASVLDEFGQYRGNGLFRYTGGEMAEAVMPSGNFSVAGQSYVYNFLQRGDGIVFSGWYRSANFFDDGIFQLRDGAVTPVATLRTSPVRLNNWFQTNGKAVAAYGRLTHDRDQSEPGAWWLEDGVLRKIASNGDTINGVAYDWISFPTIQPIGDTFDDRSVLLLGQSQVAYEYDSSTGLYAYDYDYDTLIARFDTDRDGRGDDVDNCPLRPNEDQADTDGNGIGDVCEDSDDDGTPDVLDNCPLDRNEDQANDDGDAYGNLCDLCPDLNAESQADQDGNGIGDLCDPDIDGDGFDNDVDNCPVVYNDQLANLDGDTEGDACDEDIDGDGISNPVDGRIVDGLFVDESELDSDEFTDFDLGGVSFGRILNRGGLELLIHDSEDPSQGLVAEARSGTGQARIKWCDFKGPDGVLEIVPNTEVPISCGSIEVEPRRGHVFLLLDDKVLIHAPAGTKAHLLDTNTSEILLDAEAIGGVPVTMVLDEDTRVLMEGDTLVHAVPEPSGQYVVENDMTSANPITVVSNGIELAYAPGDTGLLVAIDIKPDSDDNPINLGSNGVLPVAILSDVSFDATDVDPLTVQLASSEVRLKGKGTPASQVSDVNGDGIDDLVVQVETENLVLAPTDSTAKLTGSTYAGVEFIGEDAITIVQQ